MSNENNVEKSSADKLAHPKSPAEKLEGNKLPEELHTTVKPVPDPIPAPDPTRKDRQVD